MSIRSIDIIIFVDIKFPAIPQIHVTLSVPLDSLILTLWNIRIAASFTSVVTSFVSDILLPPLSLIPGINRNLDEKFAVLRQGKNYHNGTYGHGYNTMEQALADGAVVLAYGYVITQATWPVINILISSGLTMNRTFLNKIVNFMGVGLALYAVASIAEFWSSDPIIKHTVKCKYCRKRISEKAKRCVNCTSRWLAKRFFEIHHIFFL